MDPGLDVANTLIGLFIGGGGLTLLAKGVNSIIKVYRDEKESERRERKELRDEERANRNDERSAREKGISDARAERQAGYELREREIQAMTELTIANREQSSEIRRAIERIDALIVEIRAERMEFIADRSHKHRIEEERERYNDTGRHQVQSVERVDDPDRSGRYRTQPQVDDLEGTGTRR